MAIEIGCTGCGQTLRVADEHAGKKARCPSCGTIVQVPVAGADAPLVPTARSPFSDVPPPAPEANPFAERPEPGMNPYGSPNSPAVKPFAFADRIVAE